MKTNRLTVILDQLQESDKSALFEWINNKELVEFNSPFKPVSWDDHCTWFDKITLRPDVKIFAIRALKVNKLIGTCQLLNIDQELKSAELQIPCSFR